MKALFTFLFIVTSLSAFAQIPQPAILSLNGYGGDGVDQVLPNVTKTNDGGFIICINTGSTAGTGNIDTFCSTPSGKNIFLKYNADGSILEWSKCSTLGDYIYPRSDGSFVYGRITNGVPSGWAFKLVKEDASGTVAWQKTYGAQAASAILRSMMATDDGGYIMVGETNYTDSDFTTHYGSFMNGDIAVIKVDSNGNKVWSKVIGGSEDDQAASIVLGPEGGCYIVGSTYSSDYDCTGYHGSKDAYVVRLDSSGNVLWHKDLGGSSDDHGAYTCANGKGGIIIAAHTSSEDGDVLHHVNHGTWNIWALEIDSSSNILWSNCYGGGGEEYPYTICKATDGSIWIAGVSHFKGGDVDTAYGRDDAWFVHADSTGTFLSAKVLGSSLWDRGGMVYPLTGGGVMGGGFYNIGDGNFPNVSYGGYDAYLTVFSSWTTVVPDVNMAGNSIKMYPNPATDYMILETENNIGYEVTITDVLGRSVYKCALLKNMQIPINEWIKGMYYVQIEDEMGYKDMRKLIVQ